MKCSLLFALVIWVLTALAAVPFYEKRDVELPPGAYWEGDALVLHNDPTEYSDAEDDEFEADKRSPRGEDFELANMTSTTLTKRWDKDQNPVLLYAGGPKQHVGTLRKARLRDKIHECLKWVGSPGNPDDNSHEKGRHPEWCSEANFAYCASVCYIPNVVYNADPKPKYATNARLEIRAYWSELYESAHAGIREAAASREYDLAADTFMQMTEDSANCYEANFEGSRRSVLCNTVKNVLVVLPYAKDHPLAARLNVELKFNGKTLEGELDCEKGMKKVRESFQATYQPQLAKIMGWDKNKMPLLSACNKEACFTTRNGGYYRWNDLANKPLEPILGHFDWKGHGCDAFAKLE